MVRRYWKIPLEHQFKRGPKVKVIDETIIKKAIQMKKENKKYSEIANECNIPVHTVRKILGPKYIPVPPEKLF